MRAKLQFDIGTSLHYRLENHQRNEALFSIVDLINNGNTSKRQFARRGA
jgi:hypothetical protein